jgi:PAS domain S-box-containing protein
VPSVLRALIVEDSEDDAVLLLRELQRGGYKVSSARVDTAPAMRAALAREPWDVLISDHVMPQFSGLAALQVLKDSGLDLPFIIVSGAIGEDVAVEAMHCGAHDYIMKGRLARLVPAVERELREAEVRRQRRQADLDLRKAHDELEQRVKDRTRELARANEELQRTARELQALNETLEERVRERTAMISLLHDIASAANQAATLDEGLHFALRRVCEQQNWCFGHALCPAADDADTLAVTDAFYEPAAHRFDEFRTVTTANPPQRGRCLSGCVWASGQPEWTSDLESQIGGPRAAAARRLGLQTALAFPVVTGHEVLAVLEFFSDRRIAPDERTVAAMLGIGMQLGRVVERQRARDALRERSRQLEAFFNHSLTPFVLLDKNYNFIRVNEAYARACQRSADDFPGRNHFDLYPSDTKLLFDEVVRARQPMQVVARPFEFADHPEWGMTYWDWTLTPVLDDAGEIEFLAYSLMDVTSRKQTEDKLRHAERLAALGTFAAGVAHEINNPLAAIAMNARHGLKAARDAALTNTVLHEIVEDTERCARIVAGVLQFARRRTSEKAPVSLADVLRATRDRGQKYARQQKVRIELRLPAQLPEVHANASELEQVLFNLITNAVQASRARQVVVLAAEPGDGRVRVHVEDHGRGMSEEACERAFDPFFTTRAQDGGTGLGLSIVHGIVTEHGGTVQIASRLGHGTKVTVELPCSWRGA